MKGINVLSFPWLPYIYFFVGHGGREFGFLYLVFFAHWTTPFLFAKKERGERKSSPDAGVNSEFSYFLLRSGFDSPPCSTKPGSASLPRAYFISSKNTKTHTPAHGGRGVLVDGNG